MDIDLNMWALVYFVLSSLLLPARQKFSILLFQNRGIGVHEILQVYTLYEIFWQTIQNSTILIFARILSDSPPPPPEVCPDYYIRFWGGGGEGGGTLSPTPVPYAYANIIEKY